MQTIIGFFDPKDIHAAREDLIAAGIGPDNIVMIANERDIPDFLEGHPERTATQGGLVGIIAGAIIGGIAGGLTTYLAYTPSPLILALIVVVGAAAGAALGGYLSSIYFLRAGTEEVGLGVRDALGGGQHVLLVRAADTVAGAATAIMERHRSDRIDTYPIGVEKAELA